MAPPIFFRPFTLAERKRLPSLARLLCEAYERPDMYRPRGARGFFGRDVDGSVVEVLCGPRGGIQQRRVWTPKWAFEARGPRGRWRGTGVRVDETASS